MPDTTDPTTGTTPTQPGAPAPTKPEGDNKPEETSSPATFDEWYEEQPAEVQTLITTHTKGLKNALEAERATRGELEKKLKKMTRSEEDPEKKKELEALTGRLHDLEIESAFFRQAIQPELGVTDPDLALIAARHDKLIDESGDVDWDKLRELRPALFHAPTRKTPPAQGGAGSPSSGTKPKSMNKFIRTASGAD